MPNKEIEKSEVTVGNSYCITFQGADYLGTLVDVDVPKGMYLLENVITIGTLEDGSNRIKFDHRVRFTSIIKSPIAEMDKDMYKGIILGMDMPEETKELFLNVLNNYPFINY